MMRLHLIRHAVAFERDRRRWPDDALRPLTPAGARQFREIAPGLARLAGRPQCLFASPLLRARQTAEILIAVAGWPRARELSELAPGTAAERTLAAVREADAACIVLVGHEPHLTQVLTESIAGPRARVHLGLRKGGAACLVFEGAPRPGRGELEWLLTPAALRAMRAPAPRAAPRGRRRPSP